MSGRWGGGFIVLYLVPIDACCVLFSEVRQSTATRGSPFTNPCRAGPETATSMRPKNPCGVL